MNLGHLLEVPENYKCADCKELQSLKASINFGVFLCHDCANVHLDYNQDVRSLALDPSGQTWSKEVLNKFISTGNNPTVNASLESQLPRFYQTPWPRDCPDLIRKAFFSDKYYAKVFRAQAFEKGLQLKFSSKLKTTTLQKRLKDQNKFVERKFEVIVDRNIIQYFINPTDEQPKQIISIDQSDMFFINNPNLWDMPVNSAVLIYGRENQTRFIFISSNDREGLSLVDFYNNIRFAKFHRRTINLAGMGLSPGESDIENLTHHPEAVGYLEKTGPEARDAWRRRFCVLINRTLYYKVRPEDSYPKGTIFIGNAGEEDDKTDYSFTPSLPIGWTKTKVYPFTLKTPERSYVFAAETKEDLEMWQDAIEWLIGKPLTGTDKKYALYNEPKGFIRKFFK